MENRNLYAPPKAEVVAVKDSRVTRDGSVVVVQSGSDLPPRCITCNAPVKGPIKETRLYWHTPWLYLLILINILFYALVALIARHSFPVSPGLCDVHAAKRTRRILQCVAAGGAACALATYLLTIEQVEFSIALFLVALLMLVVGMMASRKVYAKKITKHYARLAGCKEPFLASLESRA